MTSSFCPFGKVLRVLLVQIVLGSDYSGFIKRTTVITSASFEKRWSKEISNKRDKPFCNSYCHVAQRKQ